MKTRRSRPHTHQPLYRVVRAGWADPLDASFSQRAVDNRWNTAGFPALYCCCGLPVARAVTRDLLKLAAVEIEDLTPAFRPRLVEVEWSGELIDVVSAEGIAAAGFPATYPGGTSKIRTRELATGWHSEGAEGVVCRSASLWRLGFTAWTDDCSQTGESVLFVENCRTPPVKLRHRDDVSWLKPSAGA